MTLVTCEDANISFDNARLVVMAKKVSDDELQNMTFEAQLNPNPRYPQAWYDAKGLDGYTPSSNATSSANNSSSEILESTDSSLEDISSDVSSDTDSSASSEVASSLVETTSSESAVSN